MMKSTKGRRSLRAFLVSSSVALLATAILGCSNPTSTGGGSSTPAAYTTYLYMTDGTNGHVYYYDPSTHAGSSSSLLTTSKNAAGEIKFYKGIGYVAMGTGGIYYFDPSSSSPSAKEISGSSSLNAEYFAFYSATKAYVSVATTFNTTTGGTGGVYWFNPSNPTVLTQVASSTAIATKYMQEITVGPDNMIYVAANQSQTVVKIDPSSDSVTATFTTSAAGTTGLAAGSYNGASGVFVANTGGYDSSYNALPGSIDFIPTSGSIISNVAKPTSTISPNFNPGRMAVLSNSTLAVTSQTGHTWLIALSTGAVTEVLSNGASFGSNLSIAYNNNLVYVPYNVYSTTSPVNKLYVFDTSGNPQSYSPVTVMTTSDNIANGAFYQD